MSSAPHSRPFQRLLIANRGEIAVRLLQAARELPGAIKTFGLFTQDDRSHCDLGHPHHSIELPSASSYLDINLLVEIARQYSVDAVHPGYGFLSESAEFAQRMWSEAGAIVIGPGPENLARTGNKLQSKELAEQCGVPVLATMQSPTSNEEEIRKFIQKVGFPVMIKAVDGGGGRGIRLVREEVQLENSIQRALGESPSRTVFLEKAAVDGFHHVEIQIIGDGTGQVRHLWERDCSIQRRFQKVVEFAPSLMQNRQLISQVIESALKMASAIKYCSLGTFEFLVSEVKNEFYFLEVNPRLQVEHTITESISGIDLVQTQLLLAQGRSFKGLGLGDFGNGSVLPPANSHSIQLRLCAEDPSNNFALSIGKISDFTVPSGHGIRVDTHVQISTAGPLIVGSNFDNLLAKIIVTGSTWENAVRKARRVLADTRISGVKTNLGLLRGILMHSDFMAGHTDTQWLSLKLDETRQLGEAMAQKSQEAELAGSSVQNASATNGLTSSNLLFRKGDAWSLTLQPLAQETFTASDKMAHHLKLSRVLRNDFPHSFTAEIEYTTPAATTAIPYRLQVESTTTAASALVSTSHRRGDPNNPRHVTLPLSGKLIEIQVSTGDVVAEDQVLAFVKQMKMELEVRSPRAGTVQWVHEMEEEEEDVAEGMLLVELAEGEKADTRLKGKL
ncbi:Biotin carboxylase [Penicillium diatomitis]|uniref:Biotin carboxylase n=1 Tax=Penicillium diatomitis TaxID=2819901 RepID=A0A9W9XLD2_9EURO|nr:Biotin carboxylase [Penicillium diatomitis]KAJ5495102.1 Biotin carboxylase [Penicillium diatomitis]